MNSPLPVMYTLRAPIADDYDTLASWVPDVEACTRWAGPQLQFPFAASELPLLLDSANTSSFSLTNSSMKLLGFGQLGEKSHAVIHLARIIIAPHLRSTGLGRILCQLLIAKACTNPAIEIITLNVFRDNLAALALYEGLGFLATSTSPRPGIVAMELTLPSSQCVTARSAASKTH